MVTHSYSCQENSMGRGAWCATVCGVAESDVTKHTRHHATRVIVFYELSQLYTHIQIWISYASIHIYYKTFPVFCVFVFFFFLLLYLESFSSMFIFQWASLVAQLVKNPSATQETWVRSLGWEYPLEKGKVTHSSILQTSGDFPVVFLMHNNTLTFFFFKHTLNKFSLFIFSQFHWEIINI